MTRATWTAALLLLTAFLLAYAPDVGHGFVSDDFTWLVTARALLEEPSLSALTSTSNFLRPLVTLSFAVNLWLFAHDPLAYGVINLLLVTGAASLIYLVCRALALETAGALVGAAAWAFNFHGINMSILWISGRTSLLLTLFSLLTALSVLRGRVWTGVVFCTAALLSKEEAIALPFVLLLWSGVRAAWPLALPLVGYFAVRLQTSAFWPQDAPDYYRFTTDPFAVATNIAHYLDRGGTVFALALIVLLALSGTVPRLSASARRNVFRGATWFAGGFALTVWVPVRSSLYAVFPSVGTALMLATLADAVFAEAAAKRVRRAVVVLLALPFVLWPVYRARNVRWVELADLTNAVVPQMAPHVAAMRAGTAVWIHDDNGTRANIRNAFGGQMDSAMKLHYDVTPRIEVTGGAEAPPPDVLVLELRDGRLQHR